MAPEELDPIDRRILDLIQWHFPAVSRPYVEIADQLGMTEDHVMKRLARLRENGTIREISAVFDAELIGYHSSLVAMAVPPERMEEAAAIPSRHPGVSHNYERNHRYNLWFTITVPRTLSIPEEAANLARRARVEDYLVLPALRRFKIGVDFDLGTRADWDESWETPTIGHRQTDSPVPHVAPAAPRDVAGGPPTDRREIAAIRALQRDLPLDAMPFLTLAGDFGMDESVLLEYVARYMGEGIVRRYGAVLRHQRVGYSANAMGCWAIPDERIEEAGLRAARERAISHCYERPAFPPKWPYNFFTMIHGHTDDEVRRLAERLKKDLEPLESELLFTVREFKKQRVRFFEP